MSAIECRVLVVDDSSLVGERTREWLSQMPNVHLIGVVQTESAAIAALQIERVGLLILDLQLKQGTGFGVLREIERMDQRPEVVVMTNHDIAEYRQHVAGLGVTHFLDKARDFAELPRIVQQLIDRLTTT